MFTFRVNLKSLMLKLRWQYLCLHGIKVTYSTEICINLVKYFSKSLQMIMLLDTYSLFQRFKTSSEHMMSLIYESLRNVCNATAYRDIRVLIVNDFRQYTSQLAIFQKSFIFELLKSLFK